jgi:hypothetical protein
VDPFVAQRKIVRGKHGTVLAPTASDMPGANTLFHIDTGV